MRSYDERAEEYEIASAKLSSGTLKGKEKKECKHIVEDWTESNDAIIKEFNVRFVNTLERKLQ